MKYIVFPAFLCILLSSYVWWAATGEFTPTDTLVVSSGADLSLSTVKVMDDKHIRVVFTEAVDIESITLKITKQTDNSNLRIGSITWVTDAPEAVDVTLDDELVEANSYSVTAIAAVGISGSTITDGALAIKDFATPSPLKKSQIVLSAPTNPNAVTVKPLSSTTKSKTQEIPKKDVPVPTNELPLTGMNPFLLIAIILPLTYFLLRRRAH